MSSVSPDTSRVCFSSCRYPGVISEIDSIGSPRSRSRSKVGLAVAIALPLLFSVTSIHDRGRICNRSIESLGWLPQPPVVLQEGGAGGMPDPGAGEQRLRQVWVAEGEAPELMGEEEAPAEGLTLVEVPSAPEVSTGPLQEVGVAALQVGEVPGPGHDLGRVERPLERAVVHGDLLLHPVAADEVAHLVAEVVRGDEEPVAERTEAEEAQALSQPVALAATWLGERVGDEQPTAVPAGLPAAVDPVGPLLDQLQPPRAERVTRRPALATGDQPALPGHAREGGAQGVPGDTELLGDSHQRPYPDLLLAQRPDVVAVEGEEQGARVERRRGHQQQIYPDAGRYAVAVRGPGGPLVECTCPGPLHFPGRDPVAIAQPG